MATKLAETAKQMGAAAFSQSLGKGTYDVLTDDRLSTQLTALWDCETLEDLRTHVATATARPLQNGQDRRDRSAQRAFLRAVQASLRPPQQVFTPAPALALTHER